MPQPTTPARAAMLEQSIYLICASSEAWIPSYFGSGTEVKVYPYK
jgi:hypothetical protein